MEPFLKSHDKIKGIEILFFENAEIEKIKGGSTSFSSNGNLSLLYFKDYSRFMLVLNNFYYPLMRRLPLISEGAGNNRIYEFPALNGFTFRLTLNNVGNSPALANFETILSCNSNFSTKGLNLTPRKLEPSPDDKLTRHTKEKESGPTEVIKEAFKHGIEKMKIASENLKFGSGSKRLLSRKKALDLKSLKNKNFRRLAKPTFKKDFFSTGEKLSNEFLNKRKMNKNLSETKDYKDLLKTSDSNAPSLFIYKVLVEEAILKNKDLIKQGNYKLSEDQMAEKKGFIESIKHGIHDIKSTVSGMMHERNQERGRETKTNVSHEPKTGLESMHYQG